VYIEGWIQQEQSLLRKHVVDVVLQLLLR